jgi:hypothetical protein
MVVWPPRYRSMAREAMWVGFPNRLKGIIRTLGALTTIPDPSSIEEEGSSSPR